MQIFMLIQPESARGPVGKHTSHLVEGLRLLGCTVATHPWGRRRKEISLLQTLLERLRDVLSVRHQLRHQSFDIAVVKTAHDWRTLLRDLAVVLVIRRRCRPVVLQLHGSRASRLVRPGHRAFKVLTALVLKFVDGIMVLSTEEQRQWMTFRRRPPVLVVKNPYVRMGPVESSDGTHELDASDRVLFVGRLIEEKGIFDLIDALPHVLEQKPCHLIVVGDGDQEEELRDRVRRRGLESHVTMMGYQPAQELARIYRECAAFVLPTRWDEGFPTVLAEALDAGLPIITTRIRGAADYLTENENALFVEPGDINGIEEALLNVFQNEDLRARMVSANRERVRIFEPEVVAQEYVEVLRTLVRNTARTGPSSRSPRNQKGS